MRKKKKSIARKKTSKAGSATARKRSAAGPGRARGKRSVPAARSAPARKGKKAARKGKPAGKTRAVRRTKPARAKATPKSLKREAPRPSVRAVPIVSGRKSGARKRGLPAGAKRVRGGADLGVESPWNARGLGAEAGGQSGDTEGLSRAERAASESVEELLEEGQAFEAGVVNGVENAPDADKGGVRTRQVPEDDVPQEYLDED